LETNISEDNSGVYNNFNKYGSEFRLAHVPPQGGGYEQGLQYQCGLENCSLLVLLEIMKTEKIDQFLVQNSIFNFWEKA
jgi:hypothetical protein